MACPYFYPRARLADGAARPPFPLGDAWMGECRAPGAANFEPDAATAADLCNFGYAAGACARYVVRDGPEAARFAVRRDDGRVIEIDAVRERACLPYDRHTLRFDAGAVALEALPGEEPGDACFARQAEAYVLSYLRRIR